MDEKDRRLKFLVTWSLEFIFQDHMRYLTEDNSLTGFEKSRRKRIVQELRKYFKN